MHNSTIDKASDSKYFFSIGITQFTDNNSKSPNTSSRLAEHLHANYVSFKDKKVHQQPIVGHV